LSAASAVMPSISASVFLLFDHAPTSPPMPPPPMSCENQRRPEFHGAE